MARLLLDSGSSFPFPTPSRLNGKPGKQRRRNKEGAVKTMARLYGSFGFRFFGYCFRNGIREEIYLHDRRQYGSTRCRRIDNAAHRMGCDGNHPVCHQSRPGGDDAKAESRINQCIVCLPNVVRRAVIYDRFARNPGGHKGAAFGPGVGSHFPDDGFCKGTAPCRGADEDCRVDGLDCRFQRRQFAGVFEFAAVSGEGPLFRPRSTCKPDRSAFRRKCSAHQGRRPKR